MKTSEFIKKVEKLGYEAVEGSDSERVFRDNSSVAAVYKNKVNKLDTLWEEDVPHELFDILVEYARTPIEERKDVKNYYLYNRGRSAYFNYHEVDKYYIWSTTTQGMQTQFTEEEIKNHRFRDIMELLVKEEVK